ncbi:MAG: SPFH/Band 7/PHB domain protein [Chloroflexi bacterium]|nr:SPFH/Band 7/PHB domain protein [Chloroflexota bacterium]
MTIASLVLVLVIVIVLAWLSIRIVNEYDRLVVFRLGRTGPDKLKGPGVVFLIPVIDRPVRVDLREQFIEVPSQTTITKDNAPISIDFLIYWRISDPLRSIVNVAYFAGALQGIATTTLRAVIGDILLDDVLSKRDQINEVLRTKLDEQTERWGGKVTTVEIREITPPRDVQDAMNRMLSAERNRRAVITESEGARQSAINVAEGEKQSSILRAEGKRQSAILEAEGFSQALERIFAAARHVDERTMLLQYLDTLKALGASPSTKYVLPLELTELAQRLGRFVDASADAPPSGPTGGVRALPGGTGPTGGAPGEGSSTTEDASTAGADAPAAGVTGDLGDPPGATEPPASPSLSDAIALTGLSTSTAQDLPGWASVPAPDAPTTAVDDTPTEPNPAG